MMSVKIEGTEVIINGINKMAASVLVEEKTVLTMAASETASLMKGNIDSRSGSLANSIDYKLDGLTAYIGPNDGRFGGRPVGRAVELGRSPGGGFPNWFDIAARYGVSTPVAFAMAKSIQQKGTQPGLRFIAKTFSQIVGIFTKYGIEVIYNIVNRF